MFGRHTTLLAIATAVTTLSVGVSARADETAAGNTPDVEGTVHDASSSARRGADDAANATEEAASDAARSTKKGAHEAKKAAKKGAKDTEEAVGTTTTTAANYGQPGAEQAAPLNPNLPLLSLGAGVFGVTYVSSAAVGLFGSRSADNNLFIPVVGPWIDLADRGCDTQPCSDEGIKGTLLVASGILQLGGLATMAASFFVPPSAELQEEREEAATKPSVHVMPVSMGRGAAGIGAFGTF